MNLPKSVKAGALVVTVGALAAKGLVSYAAPKFLIALGVPIDVWIAAVADWAGASVTPEAGVWAIALAIAVPWLTSSLWWPRVLPFLTRRRADQPDLLPLDEAAKWLFANSGTVRRYLLKSSVVPGVFPSRVDYCQSLIEHAGARGVTTVYARPEPGLPIYRVEPEKLEVAAQTLALGASLPPLLDAKIPRSDLSAILKWIEENPREL